MPVVNKQLERRERERGEEKESQSHYMNHVYDDKFIGLACTCPLNITNHFTDVKGDSHRFIFVVLSRL